MHSHDGACLTTRIGQAGYLGAGAVGGSLDDLTSRAKQREGFLDAACSKLGFCLPPTAKAELKLRTDLSSREFVRAVIAAEGIETVDLESYEYFKPLLALYHQHVLDG